MNTSVVFLLVSLAFPFLLPLVLLYIGDSNRRKVAKILNQPQKNVAFVHLDLGLGGAERLVVDAAMAVKSKGHTVKIFTTNHPLHHSFPETRTQLSVEVHGSWIPHHLLKKFQSVMSMVRMCFLALKVVLLYGGQYHVIFCDGVSVCVPLLKFSGAKVLFYCHYPDQLLTRKRSFLRTIYRLPINYMEQITTAAADVLMVNSRFTLSVFQRTFSGIRQIPTVLYPAVNVPEFDKLLKSETSLKIPNDKTLFFSINRFDPNKKVELAVGAFTQLVKSNTDKTKKFQLIVSGGYDPRVHDNVSYLQQLRQQVISSDLSCEILVKDRATHAHFDAVQKGAPPHPTVLTGITWSEADVIFMPDISEHHKVELMKRSLATVYTPSNEHFGIIPIESLLAGCPVIGAKSGGLLETVTTDGQNGLLCEPTVGSFAEAMIAMVKDTNKAKQMGQHGRTRVIENFSLERMAHELNDIIQQATEGSTKKHT